MTVTHSILLYGTEIWADATRTEKYRKKIAAIQRRGALRIACAYRTVSETAVLAIAGVVPVDLLALEQKRIYEFSEERGRARASTDAQTETLTAWQARFLRPGFLQEFPYMCFHMISHMGNQLG